MACWYGTRRSLLGETGILGTVAGAFFGGSAMWILVGLLAMLERGPVEDAAMKRTFGREWEDYARKVPYSFIPGGRTRNTKEYLVEMQARS
jgi:protein-S-isoprenylcysteine O-methyltransferase Ste14